jgi:hypothetical protein
MQTRTAADLVTTTLRRQHIIAGDEEASGFELDNALKQWAEVHAELVDDGLAEFPADQIPLDIFQALVRYFGDVISPNYGREPKDDPDNPMHPARERMRRRIAADDAADVVEIQEF